jgi:hypothetical protein
MRIVLTKDMEEPAGFSRPQPQKSKTDGVDAPDGIVMCQDGSVETAQ